MLPSPISHKFGPRGPLMRTLAVMLALVLPPAARAEGPATLLTSPATERRVERLLSRMTLEEKIGQLVMSVDSPEFSEADVAAGRVGAAIGFNRAPAIATLQRAARRSRQGVPLLVGLDVVHGLRTMFPHGLAEAGSFDPALARLSAEIAGREAAAIGLNWTFAPMADLARDIRWGRSIEGFGEDPLLGSLFTRARVEGFRRAGIVTTLKHFAGYGAAVGGRDYDAAEIARSTLYDAYLPPFRAGIEAGAEGIMSAFHTLNGVPATANRFLMTDVLRRDLGFRGFVVSDWQAINQLVQHGIAADGQEAALLSLKAGTDIDMAGGLYAKHLAASVRSGRLPETTVTEAARRVLRAKVAARLFEREPQRDLSPDIAPPSAEARDASRRIARDTLVLLRNEGVLPLAPDRTRRIAVIGGMAANAGDLIGPHGALAVWEDGATIAEALRSRAAKAGMEMAHAAGCDAECKSADGFDAAEGAAKESDLVVAVLGEPVDMTGEGGSRAHMTLPGRQQELLARLVATGKPVVVVLLASRPIDLGPLHDRLAGLLMAWFPGTEGGNAIADILFGDHDPSAKLAISWPRTIGQVPLTYDRLPTGRPHEPGNRYTLRYADEPLSPLYPFGFGLTYSRTALSAPTLAATRIARAGTLAVSVNVTNEGARPVREVVQLYLRQTVASVSRPRRLKAFEKVYLAPGESRTVTLRVPAADLGFHGEDGRYRLEGGPFEALVGTSSVTIGRIPFEVDR